MKRFGSENEQKGKILI